MMMDIYYSVCDILHNKRIQIDHPLYSICENQTNILLFQMITLSKVTQRSESHCGRKFITKKTFK